MKSRIQLRQELREQILNLSGVTERLNAGIHEDAFFVGGKMFVHIHGHGHCDIQLSKGDQERILAEGKARSHRWAPEAGYVGHCEIAIGIPMFIAYIPRLSQRQTRK